MNVPVLKRPTRSLTTAGSAGLGFVRHPTISRKDNRFTLVDSANNARMLNHMDEHGRIFMDIVIVDASPYPNRIYYGPGGYSEDNPRPPLCFSDNGTGPSVDSPQPQASTCASCEWSKWGSATGRDGKGIPACSNKKKLAVIVLGDTNEMLYEFTIPPASFGIKPDKDPQEGGWTWYCKSLAAHKTDLFQVVTRVSYLPGGALGSLVFKPVAMVEGDAELTERCNKWLGSGEAEDRIGLNDTAIDPAGYLPPQQAQKAHVAPPQRPVAMPIEQAKEPEPPAPKRGPGRPKAIPPFLDQKQETQDKPRVQPMNTQFGIVTNPPAAPTEVQQRVSAAFKLPT